MKGIQQEETERTEDGFEHSVSSVCSCSKPYFTRAAHRGEVKPDFVPPNECIATFGNDGTFSSWREH